jgi:hypothetical protein
MGRRLGARGGRHHDQWLVCPVAGLDRFSWMALYGCWRGR